MKRLACIVLPITLAAISAHGLAQITVMAGAETSERDIVRTPTSDAALVLLQKRVESIDWQDKPFEEIVTWLKEQGDNKVNIVPRWKALAIEQVAPETFVTLQLNNTSLGEVINEMMVQLSTDENVFRYRGTGNTLLISTKADFEKQMYVRIYDVTDLLMRVPDFGQSAPEIDLQQVQGGGGQGGGGGGQSVFGGGSGGQGGNEEEEQGGMAGEMELERRVNQIRNLILAVIHPETWEDLPINTGANVVTNATGGGGKGRIRAYKSSIVVYNTIEVHEAIVGQFHLEQ